MLIVASCPLKVIRDGQHYIARHVINPDGIDYIRLIYRHSGYLPLRPIRQQGHVQLYSSTALLEELLEVLTRPFAAQRLALIGRSAREALADYVEAIGIVEPASVPRVVANDADDDQVIAAAVAARAELIVSGDRKHLLPLGSHQGIAIVDAAEAVRRIGGG